jgi:amino acid transporter
MHDLLYKYVVTILCAFLLFFVLGLIRYGIKAYFDVQMKKANATSGVAMTGMAVLLTAFISMTGVGNTLLGFLMSGLKQLLPGLKLEPPSETASLTLFIVFAAAIAGICYMYYSQYRTKIEEIERQEQDRIRK